MEKKEKILLELTNIFRAELQNENLSLDYSSSSKTVEKWDSINNLLLISAIEEKYKIEFSIEFIFKAENVNDICEYILEHAKEL